MKKEIMGLSIIFLSIIGDPIAVDWSKIESKLDTKINVTLKNTTNQSYNYTIYESRKGSTGSVDFSAATGTIKSGDTKVIDLPGFAHTLEYSSSYEIDISGLGRTVIYDQNSGNKSVTMLIKATCKTTVERQ